MALILKNKDGYLRRRVGSIAVCVMTLGLLVCSSSFSEDVAPKEKKAPVFTLKDEAGKSFTLTFPREKPLLLTFGDQLGGMSVDKWRTTITKKYGDQIEYRGVAWLELIPKLLRGTVEKIIKESYKGTLLDWTGSAAKLYGCKSSKANVFVIDREGNIVHRTHANMTKDGLRKVYKIVDGLLEEDEKKQN